MTNSAVTINVFPNHLAAENAVKTLARTGIEMKDISIIGKNYHTEETPVGYFNAGDRAKVFGKLGAFWAACSDCCSALSSSSFPCSGIWSFSARWRPSWPTPSRALRSSASPARWGEP